MVGAVLALAVSTYLLPFAAKAARPASPMHRSDVSQSFGGSMLPLVTMQWTFHYTPAYTKVLSLAVNGVPTGAAVLLACHGRGCPLARQFTVIGQAGRCAPSGQGGWGGGGDARDGCGCWGDARDGCGCWGDARDGCGCWGDARDGCGCSRDARDGCGCGGGDAHAGCGCGGDAQAGCQSGLTIGLTQYFRRHRLGVGARITVAITSPESIGKYYMFRMRAGRAPTVQVACLPPGETQPGAAC
jgi:hypothetical protein